MAVFHLNKMRFLLKKVWEVSKIWEIKGIVEKNICDFVWLLRKRKKNLRMFIFIYFFQFLKSFDSKFILNADIELFNVNYKKLLLF